MPLALPPGLGGHVPGHSPRPPPSLLVPERTSRRSCAPRALGLQSQKHHLYLSLGCSNKRQTKRWSRRKLPGPVSLGRPPLPADPPHLEVPRKHREVPPPTPIPEWPHCGLPPPSLPCTQLRGPAGPPSFPLGLVLPGAWSVGWWGPGGFHVFAQPHGPTASKQVSLPP